jgi:hypothetical protein
MTPIRRRAGWTIGALLWAAARGGLLACPICFQIEQGPVTDGVRAAVIVLMGVTLAVLAAFGMFVRKLASADRLAVSTNLGTPEPRNPGTSGTLGSLGTPEPS